MINNDQRSRAAAASGYAVQAAELLTPDMIAKRTAERLHSATLHLQNALKIIQRLQQEFTEDDK